MVSLWCELLCKLSIYTLKSDQWITIWWAKYELECLLLIFIYSNSKFKVTWKNMDVKCRYIRTHSEEKPCKIFSITFVILPFNHQNTLIKLPSWVLWSLILLMHFKHCLKWFILIQRTQNLEFVYFENVIYTQPMHLPLTMREYLTTMWIW